MVRNSLATLALLLLWGCGYHVVRGDTLFGHQRIAVLPFREVTAMGMAPDMAVHLGHMLAASGMQLTPLRERADAVLDGSIKFATTPSASRIGVAAYQVNAFVHAELQDPQGAVLWQTDQTLREEFLPAIGLDVQPLLTETRRRTAIHRLAERAATQVHEALVIASSVQGSP